MLGSTTKEPASSKAMAKRGGCDNQEILEHRRDRGRTCRATGLSICSSGKRIVPGARPNQPLKFTGGGIPAFRGVSSTPPAPQLNLVVGLLEDCC